MHRGKGVTRLTAQKKGYLCGIESYDNGADEEMIRTPVCDLLGIEHPIALGGMGTIYAPDLVAAVSAAGGFGAMGCHNRARSR